MKGLLATPFIPISKKMGSHRAAQAMIYADQIKQSLSPHNSITVNISQEYYIPNFNNYDTLFAYHGNDWHGKINLFGGTRLFPHVYNFLNFCNFKGRVYSLKIPFPNYHQQLMHKFELTKASGLSDKDAILWQYVDWDNLLKMQRESIVVDPNTLNIYDNAAIGDSHAICMYRPGWNINSVPFKTLFGALNSGLEEFFPIVGYKYNKLEFYFGNIDIRHHILRQENPEQSIRELVQRYFEQARKLKTDVKIYEPLPIENENRSIPQTGWFEGKPFHGSWSDRNNIRNIFIDEALKNESENVKLFKWTNHLLNGYNELDFKHMETPKSVHLSRSAYPHWNGIEYNRYPEVPETTQLITTNLEDFF